MAAKAEPIGETGQIVRWSVLESEVGSIQASAEDRS